MAKEKSIEKAHGAMITKALDAHSHTGFVPCSQDMTICGDCTDNRARKKCPRLKEWLAKNKR